MEIFPDGTRRGKPITSYDAQPMEAPRAPRIYHVWVNLERSLSNAKHTFEYPGLVLAWRRGVDDYEAQVIWVTPHQDRGLDTAHMGWLPRAQLKPREG